LQNAGLLTVVVLVLAWTWFSEGPGVASRYALYLACISGNGALLAHLLKPATQRRRAMGYFLCVAVIALNAGAAYLVYPKIVLLLAFWIPGISGWVLGRLVRIAP
jgi:hypothetical protein